VSSDGHVCGFHYCPHHCSAPNRSRPAYLGCIEALTCVLFWAGTMAVSHQEAMVGLELIEGPAPEIILAHHDKVGPTAVASLVPCAPPWLVKVLVGLLKATGAGGCIGLSAGGPWPPRA
jgi:hypothetical protein